MRGRLATYNATPQRTALRLQPKVGEGHGRGLSGRWRSAQRTAGQVPGATCAGTARACGPACRCRGRPLVAIGRMQLPGSRTLGAVCPRSLFVGLTACSPIAAATVYRKLPTPGWWGDGRGVSTPHVRPGERLAGKVRPSAGPRACGAGGNSRGAGGGRGSGPAEARSQSDVRNFALSVLCGVLNAGS